MKEDSLLFEEFFISSALSPNSSISSVIFYFDPYQEITFLS